MMQGVVERVAPTLQILATGLQTWLSQINWAGVRAAFEMLGEFVLSLLPPNARALGTDYWPRLHELAKDEQLCLSWVPDKGTARSLLDAADGLEREDMLIATRLTI
jgi:hypothetical protein